MIAPECVLTRKPDIPGTDIDGEIVLMDAATGNYYSLSGSARRIWQELETPTTFASLCESLGRSYEVDRDACRRDVSEFLRQLSAQKLVSLSVAPQV